MTPLDHLLQHTLTPSDIAHLLGIAPSTVMRWQTNGGVSDKHAVAVTYLWDQLRGVTPLTGYRGWTVQAHQYDYTLTRDGLQLRLACPLAALLWMARR